MSSWRGRCTGARLASEERWLAGVGFAWTPFCLGYTVLCQHAGAPAVMWTSSGVMALYGLWVAIVGPLLVRHKRRGQTFEIDGGGVRVLGPDGDVVRRLLFHDIERRWLEVASDGTHQFWVKLRSGEVELLFFGVAAELGLEEALEVMGPASEVEA